MLLVVMSYCSLIYVSFYPIFIFAVCFLCPSSQDADKERGVNSLLKWGVAKEKLSRGQVKTFLFLLFAYLR